MAQLPMFMYNAQPSPMIDINKTQSVLDKLKQAEWDNEAASVDSSEHSYKESKYEKEEIQEKMKNFFSGRSISSSDSACDNDDDDNVSISSASTASSGLFRY